MYWEELESKNREGLLSRDFSPGEGFLLLSKDCLDNGFTSGGIEFKFKISSQVSQEQFSFGDLAFCLRFSSIGEEEYLDCLSECPLLPLRYA